MMNSEIEVPETPNWLKDLEQKRENRLKVRLGHEAGAGAPCLKCEDKCPGLDLHFWRKACKICRCPKEDHDVHDDDIYGWAQFQLLGSKPNKIKTKIVLPGKKDEVELEWAPKGQKDTIDKYLKTLPPEILPVKGSQAAQDRKQMLQKQIPFHDIDPSLCHELNEDEVKKMEEYIAHIKNSSVGVGQIVNLSSVIKANLHNISPQEAHIIASRYSKGIPFSEIVKLQSGLAKNLEKLALNDPRNPKTKSNLPILHPNPLVGNISEQNMQNPLIASKFKDITHPWYANNSENKSVNNPQYAKGFKPVHQNPNENTDYHFDENLLKTTNFDPTKTPSQFSGYHTPGYKPGSLQGYPNQFQDQDGIAFDKVTSGPVPSDISLSSDIENSGVLKSGRLRGQDKSALKEGVPYNRVHGSLQPGERELQDVSNISYPQYAQNSPYGFENPLFNPNSPLKCQNPNQSEPYDEALPFKGNNKPLPIFAPNKYDIYGDKQDPKVPKSVKDLMYSTYDPSQGPIPQDDPRYKEFDKSLLPHYDPNSSLNTYKHDPSVIGRGNLSQNSLGQYDPKSQSESGNFNRGNFDPENLTQGNLGQYDGKNPTGSVKHDPKNPQENIGQLDSIHGYDPSGNFDQRHPNLKGIINPNGTFGLGNFDPKDFTQGNFGQDDGKNPIKSVNFDPKDSQENLRQYDPTYERNPNFKGNMNPNSTFGSGDHDSNIDTKQFIPGNYPPNTFELGNPSDCANYDPINRPKNIPGIGSINPNNLAGVFNDPNIQDVDPRGNINDPRLRKFKKPLSQLQPDRINVPEDYVEPHMVNIGAIQDINYGNPDVRAAVTGINHNFDETTGGEYSPESIREILNNVKLPDCRHCKKPFEESEFAVSIDRANVLFHAGCFKCAGCNQSLADNIYFYDKETDNVYCGRDYAKIRGIPRCNACDELIFTKEYCLAENATFHLKHFCCFQCDSPLAGQDYTLEDDKPYCLPCYELSKASKCSTCMNVIKTEEIGCQLNGVHFHAEDRCFACIVCGLPLMGKKLLLRNEKLFCSHDCFNSLK